MTVVVNGTTLSFVDIHVVEGFGVVLAIDKTLAVVLVVALVGLCIVCIAGAAVKLCGRKLSGTPSSARRNAHYGAQYPPLAHARFDNSSRLGPQSLYLQRASSLSAAGTIPSPRPSPSPSPSPRPPESIGQGSAAGLSVASYDSRMLSASHRNLARNVSFAQNDDVRVFGSERSFNSDASFPGEVRSTSSVAAAFDAEPKQADVLLRLLPPLEKPKRSMRSRLHSTDVCLLEDGDEDGDDDHKDPNGPSAALPITDDDDDSLRGVAAALQLGSPRTPRPAATAITITTAATTAAPLGDL